MTRAWLAIGVLAGAACAGTPGARPEPQAQAPAIPSRVAVDSIPPGFGTLRQDDISIVLEADDYRVAALPLDESVIRLLAPDSYRGLRSTLESKRTLIMQRARARGLRDPRVWQVRFFGRTPDARFVPTDMTVTSGGREFRAIDVIGITPGFSEQRLQPRDTQVGLLVFEDGLDTSQPVTVTIGTSRNTDWGWDPPVAILRALDTERASVRARATGRPE